VSRLNFRASQALRRLSPSAPLLSGRSILAAVAVWMLVEALLFARVGLVLGRTWLLAASLAWGAFAAGLCFRYRSPATKGQRILRDLVEGVTLFALVSLLGAIGSYPLAAGHGMLVDAQLAQADRLFRFDWRRCYELVADHQWLQAIERPAYLSIFATPALLIGYFAWSGRRADIRLFIATFAVAAVLTLAIFPFIPAAGPLATLWHGPVPYMPLSALYQDQLLVALRGHRLHVVDLGALHGLVCAPSFHAASAVIYMATALRTRWLRGPIVALNVVMLLATLVEGTHYLTDLLIGALVATIALATTPALIRLTNRDHPRHGGNGHENPHAIAAE
jgi:membrane-associated phospholipid phosphatase